MSRVPDVLFVWGIVLLVQSGLIAWLLVQLARRRRDEARAKDRLNQQALAESEARAQDLAARLISVQEAERARIARELHDDASQRIAALSIGLGMVKRTLQDPGLRAELTRLQDDAMALGDQVRHLSHELHPGVLQRAGLIAALRERLAEFSERYGVDIDFQAPDVAAVPSQAALCLYRVAQETLHNIGKHAHATRVRVDLASTPRELHLTISDDGRGFDPTDGITASGLGLISLEERVRLLDGTLTVDTRFNEGTVVRARLPVEGGRYASH